MKFFTSKKSLSPDSYLQESDIIWRTKKKGRSLITLKNFKKINEKRSKSNHLFVNRVVSRQ